MNPEFGLGGYIPRAIHGLKDLTGLSFKSNDAQFMAQALVEAMNGIGWSSPNPSVGAVLVQNQQVIGTGFTQAYKDRHAERALYDSLKEPPKNATLYVTLEPCSHQGHQPPCLNLIRPGEISRVVIGCADPDPRVSGRSIEHLRSMGVQVEVGVLGEECFAWHLPFLEYQKNGNKTVWIAKWAQTPAGFLAGPNGESKWISGEESRKYTHWLRQKYDGILVGAGTWNADRPSLTVRDCAKPHRRNPTRILLDPFGKARVDAIHCESPLVVLTEKTAMIPWIEKGVECKEVDQSPGSWIKAVNELRLQSVLVEGGPRLIKELFLVNAFTAAHVFEGQKEWHGQNPKYAAPSQPFNSMRLVQSQKIQNDVLREWVKST